MSSAGELVLRTTGLVVVVAAVLTGSWAWQSRHRWGSVPAPAIVVGHGAYRRALTRHSVPRGTPFRVVVVAAIGISWGLLTSCVLAPAGLVFLLAPARHEPSCDMLLTLSGLGVLATAIGGFALGPRLVRVSRAILRREPDLMERALPIAAWSTLHHAFVLGAFVLFAIHESDPAIAAAIAAPCSIGVAHAWALSHAARFVARIPDDDDDEGRVD